MTNYSERLDEILAELLWCDKSKAHLAQHYTHRGTNHRAGANAKAAITSLIKELVAEAKPEVKAYPLGPVTLADCQRGLDHYEANLLKALEEV